MAIFHVTTRAEWEGAEAVGSYRMSTKGSSLDRVGFIHASSAEQLPRVAAFLYGGSDESLVVLELDDDGIRGSGIRIPWEAGTASCSRTSMGRSKPRSWWPCGRRSSTTRACSATSSRR
jgi:uncharacterized protein (DUF952 family)